MSLFFAFEAFKLHRIRRERGFQLLFLLFFLLQATLLIFPIGNGDFSALYEAARSPEALAKVQSISDLVTPGNWIYLGVSFLLGGVSLLASWIYSWLLLSTSPHLYLGSLEEGRLLIGSITDLPLSPAAREKLIDQKIDKPLVKRSPIRVFFFLFGFMVLHLLIRILSAPLALIPYILFSLFCYYVVPFYLSGMQGFVNLIRASFQAARKHLGLIFFANLMIMVIGVLLRWFLSGGVRNNLWIGLVGCFIVTLVQLAQGRLLALFYIAFCTPNLDQDGKVVHSDGPAAIVESLLQAKQRVEQDFSPSRRGKKIHLPSPLKSEPKPEQADQEQVNEEPPKDEAVLSSQNPERETDLSKEPKELEEAEGMEQEAKSEEKSSEILFASPIPKNLYPKSDEENCD